MKLVRFMRALKCNSRSELFIIILDMAGRRSSALHFASGYGRKDVVEHLLANGANFLKDDGGLNPCHK